MGLSKLVQSTVNVNVIPFSWPSWGLYGGNIVDGSNGPLIGQQEVIEH